MTDHMLDVVTLGEAMLRLSPPGHELLDQAATFEVQIGGSEANVAVGLARLGLRIGWLSRLPDQPLGRRIADGLRTHGVDVSRVVWTDSDRVGLYFLESGALPRGSRVLYDRQHSAMATMTPADLPTDLFAAGTARLLHTSGITSAISESAARTALAAVALARAVGWQVSFDYNYRANLWSSDEARTGCAPLAQHADLIFIPLRDCATLFHSGGALTLEEALASMHARFPSAQIVVTHGEHGAASINSAGIVERVSALTAQVAERVGAGDAFIAGALYARLTSAPGGMLRWGAACAAYKLTIPGDLPLLDRTRIEILIGGAEGKTILR